MISQNPDISIIIVSYNVKQYLCNCIDSILTQIDIVVEIIVVDNNSTDGTQELIKAKYPFVKFISNSLNVGFSAANNQGIKEASAELIMLLNPDTELVDKDTLLRVKKYMNENGQIGILAPHLLNTDGSFQPSFWNFHGIGELMLELFYMHRIKKSKPPLSPTPIQAASGAALIFKKCLTDEIGGLDENMFWMEDTDFCYRTNKIDKEVIWAPEIKIIHHGGKSSGANEVITIPNQVISKIKFSKKHNSKKIFYLINIVSLFFILSRLCGFFTLSFINRKYNAKRKAYWITLKSYWMFNFYGNKDIIR